MPEKRWFWKCWRNFGDIRSEKKKCYYRERSNERRNVERYNYLGFYNNLVLLICKDILIIILLFFLLLIWKWTPLKSFTKIKMYFNPFYLNPSHPLKNPLKSIKRILITVIFNFTKLSKPITLPNCIKFYAKKKISSKKKNIGCSVVTQHRQLVIWTIVEAQLQASKFMTSPRMSIHLLALYHHFIK